MRMDTKKAGNCFLRANQPEGRYHGAQIIRLDPDVAVADDYNLIPCFVYQARQLW